MVSVARGSLVGIESLILRSAGGASRRMVQKQRRRSEFFRFPLERTLRGRFAAPQGEVPDLASRCFT